MDLGVSASAPPICHPYWGPKGKTKGGIKKNVKITRVIWIVCGEALLRKLGLNLAFFMIVGK